MISGFIINRESKINNYFQPKADGSLDQNIRLFEHENIEKINFSNNSVQNVLEIVETTEKELKNIVLPEYVRGLYLTASSAGRDDFRQQIIQRMLNDGYLNSVVIDVKDDYGQILYNTNLEEVKQFGAVAFYMQDVKKVLEDFHQAGIYVIARQVIFQDPKLISNRPELALKTYNNNIWYNYAGQPWADPQNQEVWDYNLAIAKEAVEFGFDEINFDYIRYPSDGPIANLNYNLPEGKTRADVLKDFYIYVSKELKDKTIFSIDQFGLVLDNTQDSYDLGIGQVLADAVYYIDYISPMTYPSHYSAGYLGFENPADHPGAVISYGLKVSADIMADKKAKLRPWLQAFNLGAIYDRAKIRAQIEAVESATTTAGWLLWNARNYYPDYIFTE